MSGGSTNPPFQASTWQALGMAQGTCSFCSKTEEQVDVLVAGPGRTAICDECVGLASELVRERSTPVGDMVLRNISVLATNDRRFPG